MQLQTPLKKGKEINPKLPFLEETKLLVIDIQVQELNSLHSHEDDVRKITWATPGCAIPSALFYP